MADTQTCPTCGMEKGVWRGNEGQGVVKDGVAYCCEECLFPGSWVHLRLIQARQLVESAAVRPGGETCEVVSGSSRSCRHDAMR